MSGNPAKGVDAQDAIVKCLEKVKAGGRFKGVLNRFLIPSLTSPFCDPE